MTLDEVIERIDAAEIGLARVEGVEELIDLDTVQGALPAAFVAPARDRVVERVEGANVMQLLVEADFDVAIVMGAGAGKGGQAKVRGELRRLADAVRDLLFGWQPAASCRPLTFTGGELLGVGKGRASWVVRMRGAYRLRQQGVKT